MFCTCEGGMKVVLADDPPLDHEGSPTDSPYSNLYCASCGTGVSTGKARRILGGRRTYPGQVFVAEVPIG